MIKFLITTLLLLTNSFAFSQGNLCNSLINNARNALEKSDYPKARDYCEIGLKHCSDTIFSQILDDIANRILQQSKQLAIEKEKAEDAQKKAENEKANAIDASKKAKHAEEEARKAKIDSDSLAEMLTEQLTRTLSSDCMDLYNAGDYRLAFFLKDYIADVLNNDTLEKNILVDTNYQAIAYFERVYDVKENQDTTKVGFLYLRNGSSYLQILDLKSKMLLKEIFISKSKSNELWFEDVSFVKFDDSMVIVSYNNELYKFNFDDTVFKLIGSNIEKYLLLDNYLFIFEDENHINEFAEEYKTSIYNTNTKRNVHMPKEIKSPFPNLLIFDSSFIIDSWKIAIINDTAILEEFVADDTTIISPQSYGDDRLYLNNKGIFYKMDIIEYLFSESETIYISEFRLFQTLKPGYYYILVDFNIDDIHSNSKIKPFVIHSDQYFTYIYKENLNDPYFLNELIKENGKIHSFKTKIEENWKFHSYNDDGEFLFYDFNNFYIIYKGKIDTFPCNNLTFFSFDNYFFSNANIVLHQNSPYWDSLYSTIYVLKRIGNIFDIDSIFHFSYVADFLNKISTNYGEDILLLNSEYRNISTFTLNLKNYKITQFKNEVINLNQDSLLPFPHYIENDTIKDITNIDFNLSNKSIFDTSLISILPIDSSYYYLIKRINGQYKFYVFSFNNSNSLCENYLPNIEFEYPTFYFTKILIPFGFCVFHNSLYALNNLKGNFTPLTPNELERFGIPLGLKDLLNKIKQ